MLWRLIDTDLASPEFTVAADEAMMIARHKNMVPNTLHLYRLDRPTVTLGCSENIDEDINLEVAKENDVAIVRRASGGGAFFVNQDQILYSTVVSTDTIPEKPEETYEVICEAIVKALGYMGIKAEFKPINDIVVKGRRISRSFQIRKWDVVLQHGTLIIDADFDMMFRILKTRRKRIRSSEDMTSLTRELRRMPSIDEVKRALVRAFAEEFQVEMVKGVLTYFEERMISALIADKYGRAEYKLL
ncbi:MAG: biotin/lipoate A/B protein ligase family protein [Methanomassiliicoccales archaeon]